MFAEFIKSSDTTQSAWAARLGISPGYLSLILAGHKQPSAELMWRIERETDRAVPMQSWFTQGAAA